MTDHIYTSSLIIKAEKKTFKKINSYKVMQRAAKTCTNYITKNYSSINSSGIKPEIFNIKVKPCARSKQDALWETNIDDLKKIIWK